MPSFCVHLVPCLNDANLVYSKQRGPHNLCSGPSGLDTAARLEHTLLTRAVKLRLWEDAVAA